MEEKKLVPKLRFPGFTEPWEQRKLGELGKARSGVGFPDKEQGGKIGIPFFKVSDMNLIGNENEMTVANNYVTETQIKIHNWMPIDRVPAIFFAKVGAAVMLNRKRLCLVPFLLDNNTMAYSLDLTKWDTNFAKTLFETINLPSLVQVGALPSYNTGDIEALHLRLPSISEQVQIGLFFKYIDVLITLHQRKLEHLKLKKKSLLQKLFPKEGSVYPELRFPGFTDPWEQRKFRSLFQKNLERNDGQFPFNKTISISRMIYSESGNGASTESLDNYKVLRVGDIAFEGHENKDFKFGRFVMNDVGNGIMSPRFTVLRPLIDMELNFWKEYINYEPIMQKKLVYSTKKGTMMNELVVEDFLNQYVAVPSVQEQQKIGYLLKCMTDDITLHQRKLEHLQLLKKALLQQLFV